MTINQVYEQYKIMPNLQLHMYRVAAVAQMICEQMRISVEKKEIVLASLLHDTGNIIKFQLEEFPSFLQPQGPGYWEQVQRDYLREYGNDEHIATAQIAVELGVSARLRELISAVGFNKAQENYESVDFSKKICSYADVRVTPFGVVTLQERLEDLEKRYGAKYPSEQDKRRRQLFRDYLQKIEEQIFSHANIKPDDITNEAVEKRLGELKDIEVS